MNSTTPFRYALLLFLIGSSSIACTCSYAADDAYLKCKGEILIARASGMQAVQQQEIAAHIKDGRISFSGNELLSGETIQICTPTKDEFHFDSESCHGQSRTDPKRKYGTFNKITGALHLANEKENGPVAFVEGKFKCARVAPVLE